MTTLSTESLSEKGAQLYSERIRSLVETTQNIGKMVIIDVESGDFAVDTNGIASARILREKHPNARLFGIRIGYDVADAIGGVMERATANTWLFCGVSNRYFT
jgi:hypothetical protein